MPLQSIPIKVSLPHLKASCSTCSLYELCLPLGLKQDDVDSLDQIVNSRRKYRRGEHLYRAGDPFHSLFVIKSGFFKVFDLDAEGQEKTTGFYMAGELLGIEAINANRFNYNAVALEDCAVCEIPFRDLEKLSITIPALSHQLHRLMSREIIAEQQHILMLGNMKATQRLAAFLINLSQRFGARGYSPTHFYLRMSREEIGNYLGLSIETISRLLSKFQEEGLITVHSRDIEIKDLAGLKDLAANPA
ncbi:MAG: fumarate/nitrate reduction transcriptional regulator Fnr [Gammaproteobacteria bacterium]|nr:fumarate/nitrate reduction transcriptional regulator Fnr [Gammaproteobacteria bacterium]